MDETQKLQAEARKAEAEARKAEAEARTEMAKTAQRSAIVIIVGGIIAWNLDDESFDKMVPIFSYMLGAFTTYYFRSK